MAKFKVEVPFSGYSRGYKVYTVEADSASEAIEKASDWDYIDEDICVVRDDTDTDWNDAEAEEVQ